MRERLRGSAKMEATWSYRTPLRVELASEAKEPQRIAQEKDGESSKHGTQDSVDVNVASTP